jgi:UDP-N-acetylmuramoyl-tripeptide--D-alanyl-D-alanine ligase
VIFSAREILQATGGKLLQGSEEALFRGISTDSRSVAEGELFIALKGPQFDGHHYSTEALRRNAQGLLMEEEKVGDIRWNGYRSRTVILVPDTLRALGDLARSRRRKYGIPVLAVTGSNGKTTTKEMISACLETRFRLLKNKGNLNNLVGLPLTLLQLTEEERIVVVEMGMNVPGEIGRLTEITEPDVGLITNVGDAHLAGLGTLERVKQEKGELFRGMRQDGTLLVNQDDANVRDLASSFPGQKITFGVQNPADVMAKEVRLRGREGTSFTLFVEDEITEVILPLLGVHFISNALAAVAAATLFGVGLSAIKEALERFRPFPMRMEIVALPGGRTIINDAYNANPRSMEMALRTVSELKEHGKAVAVLGDMLELGNSSEEAHRRLGKKVKDFSIDLLIAMGEEAPTVVESAVRHGFSPENAWIVKDHSEAVALLKEVTKKGDWILVKGSRKMTMEKIVEGLAGREG